MNEGKEVLVYDMAEGKYLLEDSTTGIRRGISKETAERILAYKRHPTEESELCSILWSS